MTPARRDPLRFPPTGGANRRRLRHGVLVAVTSLAALSLAVPAAGARPMGSGHFNPAKVAVKVVTVTGFGTILESKKGLPLYVDTAPPCTAGCLVLWPPLLMPGRKTVPLGAANLGTTPFGTQLQVTYKGSPLYTFYTDSKRRPPGGQGFQSFFVATVP